MVHGKSKQFICLVIAELQHGLFHLEPVEIVLHVLRGDAPECSIKPFLEPVVQGIDMLDMEKSPLDVPAKVCPDYNMFNMVVHCISFVADMAIRTQHRPFGKRSVQAFRDFLLRQPSIATKRQVEVILPVSCHYDGSLVLGYAFAFCLSASFAGLALQVAAAFVGLLKERFVAFGYSGERTAFILLQGAQDLVPPVEGRILVDVQGGGYLVKRLLLGHQVHVCLHKPFLVELLLPRAGIFGESPAAILALEALRSVVLTETVVAVASTMRTAALFFQQGRQARAFRDCRFALIANTQPPFKRIYAINMPLYNVLLN